MIKDTATKTALENVYATMAKKNRNKIGQSVKTETGLKQSEGITTDMDSLQDATLRALELMAEKKEVDVDYLPAMASQCRKNNWKRESRRGHEEIADYVEIIGTMDDDHGIHAHILSQLRPDDRQLFALYYIEGMTQSEIQATMADVYADQSAVSRALSRLNDRISRLNLKQLVDSRFVIGPHRPRH